LIIRARVTNLTIKAKGKGEDLERIGRVTLEVENADDWQLDVLAEAMDGIHHQIAIDEDMKR